MAEISGAFIRIGFSDLLKLEYFKEYTEYDLLPNEMDDFVKPFLYALGMSVEKDNFIVDACKYRSKIDNSVKLGFCYFGKERIDAGWLANPNSSLQAFIEVERDPILKGELYRLSRQGLGGSGFDSMVLKAVSKVTNKQLNEFKFDLELEQDWKETGELLENMNEIVYQIRGVKV